uniref:Ubiquitin carboxyl-terminal hydrolase 36 n=1 Tax=Macrostomum lignano TaxID=282301 RepID=A0A1I8H134_9PLAT
IVPSVDKWCAVCEFVRYYKRYSCGPGSACYPRAFMNRLSAISPTMRLNRQEDAHEFLRGLLDYMESNCLHARKSNPLCGKSSVLCSKCGAQSQTFDDFMDLSLCIQSSNNLIDCLQRFVSADLLKDSNAYKCEKCRTKVTAMKSFSIAVGPPILTIQLNRFQWGHNSKISRFVEFPLSLDLRPFMSKRGRPVQYDLYSVVIHHGASTKFGHYYCYAKRNEAWWCLNDASVERISETRVLNSCPYILFYRRTDLSALVNNNSNSSNGARPVSTVDAPHPTPPIAAAPLIPVSSIPTSQTAAVRSIPSTSTIRVLVSSAATQAAAAQSGNSELLVSYGSPSQSPSHSSASAAASPSSTCIRLKIHKVEGNKFSCVPVPLQQQQQQQKQQLVMQLTPPQPTKSVVASASAPVDARASARTPPPSYQLPAASNSEPQQQQRHQQ